MDGEGSPYLGVDFIIEPQFGGLMQLQQAMDSTEAKVLAEAKAIERATSGMINLGGATAQVNAFGPAATRELRSVAAETNKAERAGEGMVRNLLRQAETFGKTTAEIRNMRAEQRAAAAEGQGLTELAERIRAANAALVRMESGQGGVAKGSSQMRAAMQGASFQVQDLITQISMGTNPINALAVQGGQLAGQFANVGGKAGAVASFLIGPWGLALTAGAMVLAPFVAKLFEGNDALDDAVDKLKKDAAQTDVTARAKDEFRRSQEGVTAAINDQKAALDTSAKLLFSAAEQANMAAKANLVEEVSIRSKTQARLADARVALEALSGPGISSERGIGLAQQAARDRIALLSRQEAEQTALIAAAERNLNRTRVGLAFEVAEQMSTASGRVTRQYDQQIHALRATADAQAAAGKTIDTSLTRQIQSLQTRKQAAIDAANAQERLNKAGAGSQNQIGRNIGLGDARSIVEGMGGTVTSGLRDRQKQEQLYAKYHAYKAGGPWAALAAKPGTSNHELGQALDVAKSSGVTLKRLVAAFRAKGVQLTEALDEGSHYHLAWKKVGAEAKAAATADSAANRELREAATEAKRRLDESQSYLANLTNESSVFGKTAREIKSMEVAAAAAKAPTKELRDAILAAGVELDLKKSFPSADEINNLKLAIDFDGLAKSLDPFAEQMKDLQAVSEQMNQIADQAAVMGDAMASAFGRPGEVIGGLIARMADYNAQRADLAATGMSEAEVDKKLALLRTRNTMAAISGVKSLFKEHSTAYKVMGAIEKAHAALQLVNAIRSIAMDSAKTASSVTNSGVRAAADGVAAIAKAIASLPFPFNIAAGAATAAALVAFGVKVFGGGGGAGAIAPMSAEDRQAAAGTVTVLGDSKARSESIARSLELVAANTNRDLEFSNDMLRALRSIDTSISRMAGTVARQVQVSGGLFDTSGQNLGTNSKSGFLGLFGGSTTTRTLYDLGMSLNAASVADIIAGGISGQTYQTIEAVKKKKGFLGIGGSTKTYYDTTYGAVDPAITSAVQDVVKSLRNGLVTAADMIGLQGAQAILDSFQVELGQISFKDMTGAEIEDQLNAVFSSIGDQMAGTLLPSIRSMQEVGEGLFETFIRVGKEYRTVDVALQSIGRTFGAIGLGSIEARNALVQLFDGLEGFVEATDLFRDQFLTEAEQMTPIIAAVRAEIGRLGLTGVTTREQFKSAVLGLDLTTEAGRQMYASLMALAPAFDKVLDYQEQASKASTETVDTFRRLADGLRKYRDTLFGMEAGQGNAYETLRARFAATAASAAQGDRAALEKLESDGKAFLDVARNNASTLEQYQRDAALVARGVDAGIFAADEAADYAQLQLDALKNAVTLLGSINANTAVSAGSIPGLPSPAMIAPPSAESIAAAGASYAASAPPTIPAASQELQAKLDELILEMAAMRSDTTAGLAAVAGNTGRMARTLDDVTAEGGGMALATVSTL